MKARVHHGAPDELEESNDTTVTNSASRVVLLKLVLKSATNWKHVSDLRLLHGHWRIDRVERDEGIRVTIDVQALEQHRAVIESRNDEVAALRLPRGIHNGNRPRRKLRSHAVAANLDGHGLRVAQIEAGESLVPGHLIPCLRRAGLLPREERNDGRWDPGLAFTIRG